MNSRMPHPVKFALQLVLSIWEHSWKSWHHKNLNHTVIAGTRYTYSSRMSCTYYVHYYETILAMALLKFKDSYKLSSESITRAVCLTTMTDPMELAYFSVGLWNSLHGNSKNITKEIQHSKFLHNRINRNIDRVYLWLLWIKFDLFCNVIDSIFLNYSSFYPIRIRAAAAGIRNTRNTILWKHSEAF